MRIPNRGVIPPGKFGLIVLAAAVAPIVLKKCKPAGRAVAKGLGKFADKLRELSEEDPVEARAEETGVAGPPTPEPKQEPEAPQPPKAKPASKPKAKSPAAKAKPSAPKAKPSAKKSKGTP